MKENNIEKSELAYPKLKLGIDRENEVEVFMMFWKNYKTAVHADLKFLEAWEDEEAVERKVREFVDDYYEQHLDRTGAELDSARREWQEKERSFFEKAKKYFGDHPWPSGDYQASGSIWSRYPRYIQERSFTFPLSASRPRNLVIAHEMLHFLEYDYLQKKFGLEASESRSRDNTFWQFTENLNALIEQEDDWQDFASGIKGEHVKPECRRMYGEMKKIWKGDNVDEMVEEILVKRRQEFLDDPEERFNQDDGSK